ncbi:MAG: ABC transporter permease, partial [Planctomycetota bacterium]|nr:ABC transporter permease [Planctomycetota bacterium]
IPVVALTGMFIGMILALEGFAQFAAIGQEDRIGGVINASVTKQIGPVLAAVMVAGRVGGALAAELGTMKVTEQLEALKAMGSDPIRVLVVPRLVACIIMTPILTIYSDILGAWGAWFVVVEIFGVPGADYWYHSAAFVTWWEPVGGLSKSLFFGAAIGLAACYKGFFCRPGAAGVGNAATAAFVSSFIAIIMINLVLAKFLNEFRNLVDPLEASFFFKPRPIAESECRIEPRPSRPCCCWAPCSRAGPPLPGRPAPASRSPRPPRWAAAANGSTTTPSGSRSGTPPT